jgi:hypothetical protein
MISLLPPKLTEIFWCKLFFYGTGIWNQGRMLTRQALLLLKQLHQPFLSRYVLKNYLTQDWLQTMIVLITVSWIAKIIGVSHQHPLQCKHLKKHSCFNFGLQIIEEYVTKIILFLLHREFHCDISMNMYYNPLWFILSIFHLSTLKSPSYGDFSEFKNSILILV